MKTQTTMILEYMQEHGAITPLEALTEIGCMRLAARISDLRRMGYDIETVPTASGEKRYASYRLVERRTA